MKTILTKTGRLWLWEIKQGRKTLFYGYRKTKKEAAYDAKITAHIHSPKHTPPPISVERNPINGSWEIAAMVDGCRVFQAYYFFTKSEAIADFYRLLQHREWQSRRARRAR